MDFGIHIRHRREALGLSLREAATRVNVDPSYLSRVEAGKAPPSDLLLGSLASVLGCDLEELSLRAGRLPESTSELFKRDPAKAATALKAAVAKFRSSMLDVAREEPLPSISKSADTADPQLLAGQAVESTPEPPAETQEKAQPGSTKGVDKRNKLNVLTAKEWIPETISVWTQRGLGAGHKDAQIERQHPAPFSYRDVSRLIRFFTKPGETVLDPFVGVGSTLKACAIEGRKGIGIELNERYAALARTRLDTEVHDMFSDVGGQEIVVGDAREVIRTIAPESVAFVVTSPPYWNILRKEDHKAKQERKDHELDTNYGDDPRDLGNIDDYGMFLDELSSILGGCRELLLPRRYMAVIVSDFRDKSNFIMFHADLARALDAVGLGLRGITVLYQRHKRIFPYGYPYAFVPNIHHQYILILQRER